MKKIGETLGEASKAMEMFTDPKQRAQLIDEVCSGFKCKLKSLLLDKQLPNDKIEERTIDQCASDLSRDAVQKLNELKKQTLQDCKSAISETIQENKTNIQDLIQQTADNILAKVCQKTSEDGTVQNRTIEQLASEIVDNSRKQVEQTADNLLQKSRITLAMAGNIVIVITAAIASTIKVTSNSPLIDKASSLTGIFAILYLAKKYISNCESQANSKMQTKDYKETTPKNSTPI